eukprot:CAMPEP_0114225242 /NCGR_PEP_ID=MMETSP0058-20121206/554_1 /TAXON_ID=36894 /ORGANISM="Pyramimonas parkeae, CCMP726" /LENGTH=108 /DNA_ID=CAMNT_0001335807 /DNA_START=650 /DNA_END=976 /DNA_ORIENTATION=-
MDIRYVQVARSVWYLMRKTCVIDAQAQPRAVLPSWKEPEQNVQGDLWSGLPPTKPVNAQAATKSNWTRQQQLKPGEDRTAGISSAQYESSRFTSTGLKIVRDGWGRSF